MKNLKSRNITWGLQCTEKLPLLNNYSVSNLQVLNKPIYIHFEVPVQNQINI
jgi:hypothetical protein